MVSTSYERETPGEILDIKQIGSFNNAGHRITGRRTGYYSSQSVDWEFVHVAIDDHSRLARADSRGGADDSMLVHTAFVGAGTQATRFWPLQAASLMVFSQERQPIYVMVRRPHAN